MQRTLRGGCTARWFRAVLVGERYPRGARLAPIPGVKLVAEQILCCRRRHRARISVAPVVRDAGAPSKARDRAWLDVRSLSASSCPGLRDDLREHEGYRDRHRRELEASAGQTRAQPETTARGQKRQAVGTARRSRSAPRSPTGRAHTVRPFWVSGARLSAVAWQAARRAPRVAAMCAGAAARVAACRPRPRRRPTAVRRFCAAPAFHHPRVAPFRPR